MQDQISRREGYNISNTSNQYIVPTDGKPIRGLLQESIDSNVKMDKNLFKHYSQKNLNKVEENDIHNNSYNQVEKLRKKYESVILKESTLDINVDTVVKNTLNEETSKAPKNWLEKGIIYPFLSNRFAMMIKNGSKGSVVNQTLVIYMLGQQ